MRENLRNELVLHDSEDMRFASSGYRETEACLGATHRVRRANQPCRQSGTGSAADCQFTQPQAASAFATLPRPVTFVSSDSPQHVLCGTVSRLHFVVPVARR